MFIKSETVQTQVVVSVGQCATHKKFRHYWSELATLEFIAREFIKRNYWLRTFSSWFKAWSEIQDVAAMALKGFLLACRHEVDVGKNQTQSLT